MRKFLSAVLVAGAALAAVAEDKKPADEKKPAEAKKADDKGEKVTPPKRKSADPSLKVGDKAPAFKPDKWLQGAEVKAFEAGKVYVVEFWATWCGPCIMMMPHMGELQHEFKDKGVTFIGFSDKDEQRGNTAEKVEAFVKKRGPKLGYTFAFSDDRDINEAWMTASGRQGIPNCFVVDKSGAIAYVGHPMYLDIVLPKVVDGSWQNDADVKRLDAIEKEVDAVFESFGAPKPEDTLKVVADFEAKYPRLNKVPYFVAPKLGALLKAKKYDDAKLQARNVITRAVKGGDEAMLGQVSAVLRGPDAKGQKDVLALSVKAAEENLKLAGEKDTRALAGVAQAHIAAGDKAKGKEYTTKALDAAEGRARSNVALTIAQAAIQAGDKAAGLDLAEKAVETAAPAQKPFTLTNVAAAFVAAGDKPTGEEYAKKAVEAAAGANAQVKASVFASLAQTYLSAGEKKAAADYAKQAIDAAADNGQLKAGVYVNLARAYYAAGEKGAARGYAEKAVENAPARFADAYRDALKQILNDPDGKSEK